VLVSILEFLTVFVAVGAAAFTVVSVARLFVKWRLAVRGHGPGAAALEERLARLETAVESLTVETGRLADGHRFFTQLLVNRPATPAIGSGASSTDARNGAR